MKACGSSGVPTRNPSTRSNQMPTWLPSMGVSGGAYTSHQLTWRRCSPGPVGSISVVCSVSMSSAMSNSSRCQPSAVLGSPRVSARRISDSISLIGAPGGSPVNFSSARVWAKPRGTFASS